MPVINVSWHDAAAYCQWLSEQSGKDNRLPSEARWEYACRAGSTTAYHSGKQLSPEQANFDQNNEGTVPVDKYKPNDFGLYQMHGNVWEWCEDTWHDDYNSAPTDGSARSGAKGDARALRGGSWLGNTDLCRCSCRSHGFDPDLSHGSVGFRLSCLSPI